MTKNKYLSIIFYIFLAPGSYNPEACISRGPQFTISRRPAPEKPKIETPAPGAYSPEKVNLDQGPKFSISGKSTPEKPKTPTPGKTIIFVIPLYNLQCHF